MSRIPVLLSRTLDPVLGVFTGLLAFYLNEHNPRTAPPPGETLLELARWKRDKWQQSRQARAPEHKAAESDMAQGLSTAAVAEAEVGSGAEKEGESRPREGRRHTFSDAEDAQLGSKIEGIMTKERT